LQNKAFPSKVVLITGAARRIGAEVARTLHASGMNMVLHYNASEEEAVNLCQSLNAKREKSAALVQGDLAVSGCEKEITLKAYAVWQRLDGLVNNASRFYRTLVGEVTENAWDDLLACNLKAPFFLAQAAAPFLAETGGVIVNITDIYAEVVLRDYSVYCISKSGLLMMTKVLAKELAPRVRVNAVAPGSIMWPEKENSLSDGQKQKIINQTTLLRQGMPVDIAKAVLFFIRDADYITGQVINVDGGRML
jgi:pteridine reductase